MDVVQAIEKYMTAIRSDEFARYEKKLGQTIVTTLSEGYRHKSNEETLVESLAEGLNLDIQPIRRPSFGISTRSFFIHGSKSQVEFNYYGQRKQRELGDMIFIIVAVFGGEKLFEKFTITQFKKDNSRSKIMTWAMNNKPQLYLLSRFPSFRGVSGSIIPMRLFDLPNDSGCLGSYAFLHRPGDFAFLSATEIDSFVGTKNSLKNSELSSLANECDFRGCLRGDWQLFRGLLGNDHHARNAFDFTYKYLRFRIGEPTYAVVGQDNSQARAFLLELLSAMRMKVGTGKARETLDEFFRYRYAGGEKNSEFRENVEFDRNGGGIGIVHTTINLGE
jgi:hypothetical protein